MNKLLQHVVFTANFDGSTPTLIFDLTDAPFILDLKGGVSGARAGNSLPPGSTSGTATLVRRQLTLSYSPTPTAGDVGGLDFFLEFNA